MGVLIVGMASKARWAAEADRAARPTQAFHAPSQRSPRQKCYIEQFMSAPNSIFVRACKALPVERTPVWFMRQAGRYMPEYRAVRKQHSLLEICKNPRSRPK